MLTTLISFLGGSFARMLWGEISAMITKWQDHSQEIERMKLQGELDAQQHARNMEAQKLQAELGVQVIRVQGEEDVGKIEADGWLEAVKATGRSIGVAWVDAWNAAIRPGVATWSIAMMTCAEFHLIAQLSENTASVCAAALGIYLADRSLMKRGK